MDEWINKMCYLQTMEYYSVLERKEILPYTTIWMRIENIRLSGTSQSQKDRFHLYEPSKVLKFIEVENRTIVIQVCEEAEKENSCFKRIEFLICKTKMFLCLTLLNCERRNDSGGKFYVMCILTQQKRKNSVHRSIKQIVAKS